MTARQSETPRHQGTRGRREDLRSTASAGVSHIRRCRGIPRSRYSAPRHRRHARTLLVGAGAIYHVLVRRGTLPGGARPRFNRYSFESRWRLLLPRPRGNTTWVKMRPCVHRFTSFPTRSTTMLRAARPIRAPTRFAEIGSQAAFKTDSPPESVTAVQPRRRNAARVVRRMVGDTPNSRARQPVAIGAIPGLETVKRLSGRSCKVVPSGNGR